MHTLFRDFFPPQAGDAKMVVVWKQLYSSFMTLFLRKYSAFLFDNANARHFYSEI